MNSARLCTLALMFLVCGALLDLEAPRCVRASPIGEGVLTGELVITNAAQNRFRLVGHGGSFVAPPGLSVEDFDGKPVRVEFSRGGRVLQISQMPIRYEPITHSFEVVSGELLVRDRLSRTFAIAGVNRVFVAPAGVDIDRYASRMVRLSLDEQGQVLDLSPAGASGETALSSTCAYAGDSYSDGAMVCQSGMRYRCDGGTWRSLGTLCAADAPISRLPRACLLGDASLASGVAICRGGTTFRCVDGNWINVGTRCR